MLGLPLDEDVELRVVIVQAAGVTVQRGAHEFQLTADVTDVYARGLLAIFQGTDAVFDAHLAFQFIARNTNKKAYAAYVHGINFRQILRFRASRAMTDGCLSLMYAL